MCTYVCVSMSLENSPHIPVMVKVNMISIHVPLLSFQSLFVSLCYPPPPPYLLISCECVCEREKERERARRKATVSVDFAVSLNSAHSISFFLFLRRRAADNKEIAMKRLTVQPAHPY